MTVKEALGKLSESKFRSGFHLSEEDKSYIDEKGCKDSEIYKKVDIDRKLFSKIRCSENYIPRRNVIIKLCLALGLEKYDFNKLLNSAGYSLSNSQFDLVISYCLGPVAQII